MAWFQALLSILGKAVCGLDSGSAEHLGLRWVAVMQLAGVYNTLECKVRSYVACVLHVGATRSCRGERGTAVHGGAGSMPRLRS